MSEENIQTIVVWSVLIAVLGLRFFRFRMLKKQIPNLIAQGATVVDVRGVQEYSQGARPGSLNIPLDMIQKELDGKLQKLDKNQPVILCCATGVRSSAALRILRANGFRRIYNAGPWKNTLS